VEDLEPGWSSALRRADTSPRAAAKDAIVLRLLRAHPGRTFAREEVYEVLHREWRGEGGIMLRDVDACAARLAFGEPGIVLAGARVGAVAS
jgi:hypothetical protein